MEPHACLAVPRGEDLTVYVSSQIVAEARNAIASTLKIDPERIHVVAPFVGGGFGSKLGIHSETILAALAARRLKQPVKVVHDPAADLPAARPAARRPASGFGWAPRGTAGWSPIAHDVTMHTEPPRGVRRADGRHDARPVRRAQPV